MKKLLIATYILTISSNIFCVTKNSILNSALRAIKQKDRNLCVTQHYNPAHRETVLLAQINTSKIRNCFVVLNSDGGLQQVVITLPNYEEIQLPDGENGHKFEPTNRKFTKRLKQIKSIVTSRFEKQQQEQQYEMRKLFRNRRNHGVYEEEGEVALQQ